MTSFTQTGSGGVVAAGTATNSRTTGGYSGAVEAVRPLGPQCVFQVNLYPSNELISLINSTDRTLQKVLHVKNAGQYHHGDTFTVSGMTGMGIRDAYTTKVVGDTTSFPLMLVSIG
jgi:hypothetical protein